MIQEVQAAGAQIKLIPDGDVLASVATAFDDYDIDIYMGIGGAPEGVLAAAALKGLGGQMQGKLILDDDVTQIRAKGMGIMDFERVYNIDDMVSGDAIFCATGVTSGDILKGVKASPKSAEEYHSIVISSVTQTATMHQYYNASDSESE